MATLIGQRLREARDAAGVTRRALAIALDVTEETVRAWECDDDSPGPRLEHCATICETIAISPARLVLGREQRAR